MVQTIKHAQIFFIASKLQSAKKIRPSLPLYIVFPTMGAYVPIHRSCFIAVDALCLSLFSGKWPQRLNWALFLKCGMEEHIYLAEDPDSSCY